MPLILRPMSPADLDAYSRILTSAFWIQGLLPHFYPNGQTPASLAYDKQHALEAMQDPRSRHMAVFDTSLTPADADLANMSAEEQTRARAEGRLLGVGSWKFYTESRSEEQLDKEAAEAAQGGLPPDCDEAVMGGFLEAGQRCKREVLGGKAFIYLHILATDREHHRKGVGAMHLKWGLAEADRLGLPAYLEASPNGRPLYERWGFEPLREFPFDLRDYGAKANVPHMLMLRPAKASTNGV